MMAEGHLESKRLQVLYAKEDDAWLYLKMNLPCCYIIQGASLNLRNIN